MTFTYMFNIILNILRFKPMISYMTVARISSLLWTTFENFEIGHLNFERLCL